MAKIKILTIGSDRKIFEAGSEVRARQLEYAGLFEEYHIVVFSKKNFQFSIFNFQSISKIQISENCWVYPTNSLSRWFYIFDAVRIGSQIIRDSKFLIPDSALTAQDPFEAGWAVYQLARKFRLKFQLQVHTDFLSPYFKRDNFLNRIRVVLARFLLPKANGIRVVSNRIKDSLQATSYQLQATPVVLPIFVDVEKIKSALISVDIHKKYSQFEKIILMVARLSPEKNVGFGIEIFSKIIKKFPKCGLIIVGDGPLKNSLKLQVTSYKLGTQIIFDGFQNKEMIYSYLTTADLFLQTSSCEGYGLALVEALASGCKVVSTDVGVVGELQSDGQNMFTSNVGDVSGLIKQVEQGLSEGNRRSQVDFLNSSSFPTKSEYLTRYQRAISEM